MADDNLTPTPSPEDEMTEAHGSILVVAELLLREPDALPRHTFENAGFMLIRYANQLQDAFYAEYKPNRAEDVPELPKHNEPAIHELHNAVGDIQTTLDTYDIDVNLRRLDDDGKLKRLTHDVRELGKTLDSLAGDAA